MKITLGALGDSLEEQFEKEGLEYCASIPLDFLQRCVDAISLLRIQGYLSDSEAVKARKRLIKDIRVRRMN
jgi:hypothetical protein